MSPPTAPATRPGEDPAVIQWLATDLDGTFFPPNGEGKYRDAMRQIERLLSRHHISLLFVTGRSLDHVMEGIAQHNPPRPAHIICDVGTTLMHRDGDGNYVRDEEYQSALLSRMGNCTHIKLRQAMASLHPQIVPQCDNQQTELKCSFN